MTTKKIIIINMFKKTIHPGLLLMLGKIDKFPASSAEARHRCQIILPPSTIIMTSIS